MARKKIYYTEDKEKNSGCELRIYPNDKNELFISLDKTNDPLRGDFIAIPKSDAIEIITSLAYYYNLIDDDYELGGRNMWLGGDRIPV